MTRAVGKLLSRFRAVPGRWGECGQLKWNDAATSEQIGKDNAWGADVWMIHCGRLWVEVGLLGEGYKREEGLVVDGVANGGRCM